MKTLTTDHFWVCPVCTYTGTHNLGEFFPDDDTNSWKNVIDCPNCGTTLEVQAERYYQFEVGVLT
jgi:rubrerythrin